MVRVVPGLICAVLMTPYPADAAVSISPEEAAVRCAYSAVVLRTRMATISSSYFTDRLSTDAQLAIEVGDVHAGPVSEILSTPLSRLVTIPSGELMITTPGSFSMRIDADKTESGGSVLAVQGWGPVSARYNFNNDLTLFDAPVRRVLETDLARQGAPYSRYVTFSVALSARGKERSYKALALFREGSSEPTVVDYILGSPEHLIGKDLVRDLVNLPQVLPVPETRKVMLRELLRSIEVTGNCQEDSATQLCCDPISGMCGISSRALNR